METIVISLTFETFGKIRWYDHSNDACPAASCHLFFKILFLFGSQRVNFEILDLFLIFSSIISKNVLYLDSPTLQGSWVVQDTKVQQFCKNNRRPFN